MKKSDLMAGKIIIEESDYIDLDPDATMPPFDGPLRLVMESTGHPVILNQPVTRMGSDEAECDITLKNEEERISGVHVIFYHEKEEWYVMDNHSLHGSWLEGTALTPGIKYLLHPEDVLDLGHAVQFRYRLQCERKDTPELSPKQKDPDLNHVLILETAMEAFSKSGNEDQDALRLLLMALCHAPLYLPVEIDVEAMFGSVNPMDLKAGDVLQTQNDTKLRVLTMNLNENVEIVPLFTSKEEVEKGPAVSVMRCYPRDYSKMLLNMNKPAIINPFSEFDFFFGMDFVKEVMIPMIEMEPQEDKTEQSTDDLIGCIFLERYKFHSLQCTTRNSRIYAVADLKQKRTVAAKVYERDEKNKFDGIRRNAILAEASTILKLNHSAIPKIYDIYEDERHTMIFMEFVEGETLDKFVKNSGAASFLQVSDWGIQLCDVLQYMHSLEPAHYHRDIKPSNIILQPDGRLKLIDFGSTAVEKEDWDADTLILGTRGYAAPEQWAGLKNDARTDIFALGKTLHYLITGKDPNLPGAEAYPIRKYNENLPEKMECIIMKCIAFDPKDRYQTCEELKVDLEAVFL